MAKRNDFLDMDLKNGFQLGPDTGTGPEPTMEIDTGDAAKGSLKLNRFQEPFNKEPRKIKNWKQRAW